MSSESLFRFEELKARCTLEDNVAMILATIQVVFISGNDTFRIVQHKALFVQWLTDRARVRLEGMCAGARLRDGSFLVVCVGGRK